METPVLPKGLHHVAYVTHDSEATIDFYTRIMGMKLVSAVVDDEIPSTGDPYPYVHLFFEMGDGSTLAFFESVGLPEQPKAHPAYDVFNHIALDVGSVEAVDQWAGRLREFGVEVTGPTDHGIIYSIYFYDNNNIRLELTTTTVPSWKEHHEQAGEDLKDWIRLKKESVSGDPDALVRWIHERRRKHRELTSDS